MPNRKQILTVFALAAGLQLTLADAQIVDGRASDCADPKGVTVIDLKSGVMNAGVVTLNKGTVTRCPGTPDKAPRWLVASQDKDVDFTIDFSAQPREKSLPPRAKNYTSTDHKEGTMPTFRLIGNQDDFLYPCSKPGNPETGVAIVCGDRSLGDDKKHENMVSNCKYEANFLDRPQRINRVTPEPRKKDDKDTWCRKENKINIVFESAENDEVSSRDAQLQGGSVTSCGNVWQVDPDPITQPGFSFIAYGKRQKGDELQGDGVTQPMRDYKFKASCRLLGQLESGQTAYFFVNKGSGSVLRPCNNKGISLDCTLDGEHAPVCVKGKEDR